MMKARILGWAFLLLALSGALAAQERKELRLDVAGEIGIDPQGAVFDYRIETILPPEMKVLVEKAVRQWTFEPVLREGQPVHAKSKLRLTLAAVPVEKGYQLRVEDIRFFGTRQPLKMVPPRYPMGAMEAGVGADILVAVRIGVDGTVQDAFAAQSRLINAGNSEKRNRKWEKLFEQPTLDAVKDWKFQAADLAAGDAAETTLLVPVSFRMEGMPSFEHGWREGPSTAKTIPWLPTERQKYDASGLKEGESIALDSPVRMKASVVGTTL